MGAKCAMSQMRASRITVALVTVALVTAAACGNTDRDDADKASRSTTSAPPAGQPKYLSTSIPDSEAGRQLRWMLDAARSLPIPLAQIEEHFSAEFLTVIPADQLNAILAQAGDASKVRVLGVLAMTPTTLDVAIDPGTGEPRQVIFVAVDGEGRIAGFGGKPFPLASRSSRGLSPVSLPKPTGPSPVGTETIVATDAARDGRRIPVQLWYPAASDESSTARPAPYAPPRTAALLAEQLAVPVEDVVAVRTNATSGPKVANTAGRLPVVLFSPGAGVSRPFYSSLAAELASRGYLVAALDHPGEGQPVEFPDGSVVAPVPVSGEDAFLAQLPVRVADARSVLDLLEGLDAQPGSRLNGKLDLDKVALAGHSFGGATAAEAMRLDRRFLVGINLDGTLYGDVVATGLDRPFLLVSSDRPDDPEEDDTWIAFRKVAAKAQSITIDGTGHMDFSDFPALASLRLPDEPREALQLGTIDPRRSLAVQSAFVVAFLDRHLRGEREPLLDGPSPLYPEVRFRSG